MKKEVKCVIQGHRASNLQNQDSVSGCLAPESMVLNHNALLERFSSEYQHSAWLTDGA